MNLNAEMILAVLTGSGFIGNLLLKEHNDEYAQIAQLIAHSSLCILIVKLFIHAKDFANLMFIW